ncbi:hypothetical protein ABPG77_008664 [Micractinium sp. CCAP 211/92]
MSSRLHTAAFAAVPLPPAAHPFLISAMAVPSFFSHPYLRIAAALTAHKQVQAEVRTSLGTPARADTVWLFSGLTYTMQELCATCSPALLGQGVIGAQRRAFSALQRPPVVHRGRQSAQIAFAASCGSSGSGVPPAAAADSSSSTATATLLQRVLASCSLGDRGTLMLAAVLAGGLLFGVAEPALAALPQHAGEAAPTLAPQLVADLAENEDFWGNVLRYISYFFSVLLGTVYIAVRPLLELLKRPTTAVLVVAGLGALVFFVSFTVQAMLGINDPVDYTASSIVTPLS